MFSHKPPEISAPGPNVDLVALCQQIVKWKICTNGGARKFVWNQHPAMVYFHCLFFLLRSVQPIFIGLWLKRKFLQLRITKFSGKKLAPLLNNMLLAICQNVIEKALKKPWPMYIYIYIQYRCIDLHCGLPSNTLVGQLHWVPDGHAVN